MSWKKRRTGEEVIEKKQGQWGIAGEKRSVSVAECCRDVQCKNWGDEERWGRRTWCEDRMGECVGKWGAENERRCEKKTVDVGNWYFPVPMVTLRLPHSPSTTCTQTSFCYSHFHIHRDNIPLYSILNTHTHTQMLNTYSTVYCMHPW